MKLSDLPLRRVVIEYLRECFTRRTPPRVDELARRIGIARQTLQAQFKRQVGIDISAFLKRQHVAYAQHLLLETDLSVEKIAEQAGFGSQRAMLRSFAEAIGRSPDAYRREFVRR